MLCRKLLFTRRLCSESIKEVLGQDNAALLDPFTLSISLGCELLLFTGTWRKCFVVTSHRLIMKDLYGRLSLAGLRKVWNLFPEEWKLPDPINGMHRRAHAKNTTSKDVQELYQ